MKRIIAYFGIAALILSIFFKPSKELGRKEVVTEIQAENLKQTENVVKYQKAQKTILLQPNSNAADIEWLQNINAIRDEK